MDTLCALCNTKIAFLNRPTFGMGKLKDGTELCTKCYQRMALHVFHGTVFKGKEHTIDSIRLAAQEYESKKQAKTEAIIRQKQETVASTQAIRTAIAGKKTFEVKYIGGYPNVEKTSVRLCATEDGIMAYREDVFGSNMHSIFVLPWQQIVRIEHAAEASGDSSSKTALTTAGLLQRNNLYLVAGVANKGQTTTHFLAVTLRDATGFEYDVVFESDKARDITLHLTGQRQVLLKGVRQ